jgi:hypothetical protein
VVPANHNRALNHDEMISLHNQVDRSQVTTMELSKGLVQQLMNLLDVMQHMLYQDAVQSFFCVEET